MGRPSLAAERRAHIVSVTIDCIAAHGFGGTTLDRIAEMAGMARGHVRHYAGNRETLLTDAARAFYFGAAAADIADVAEAAARGPLIDSNDSIEQAVDYLLEEFAEPNAENAAAFAFMDASRTMPPIHDIVLSAYAGMERSINVILCRTFPEAGEAACRQTAYALVATAIGHLWFMDLEQTPQRIDDARAHIESLVRALSRDRSSSR